MEKQLKLKNKILKVLPKAVAAMRFQNPPFSPSRIHKSRSENTRNKGFSGSMIPHETRKKPNRGSNNDIDYQEPTSPKISCMGQIKHDKKRVEKAKTKEIEVKKNVSTFKKMLFYAAKPKSISSAKLDCNKNMVVERVTSMSHMKRFKSGRDIFADFDWKDQVVPHEIDCCCSDEDRVDDEGKVEGFIIPFSAPILISCSSGNGGYYGEGVIDLKPRKEINLWKRRTMAQPKPLQFESLK
ncbi:hypothetical protein TanjilG_05426 [Lupinus angustifolius]|uniref:Syringolide-induced protein 14-1-1 n=1 Tax=Lupinus angustifolius TaxID=3871 RepID=A0A1J7IKN4_LUPAN|nr:PREDICTED: uncharacterized protein At1g76070-like [Lupinus angustifolius]OIW14805.1 hypothetical protein TanjilG_05426 [Lupinus angustifolius]